MDMQGRMSPDVAGYAASLHLPLAQGFVAAALDFVERLMRCLDFDARESLQFRLALEELCTFLRSAVFGGRDDMPVEMQCAPRADGLLVTLILKGMPLDFGALPEYDPAAGPAVGGEDGLDLFLARKNLDRLLFVNRGRDGLELQLFKNRRGAHIDRQAGASARVGARVAPRDPGRYAVRPLASGEALEVSRCAYLVYGHSYEDYIYYPERVAEMNLDGGMRSLLAVAEDGAIMGHCALKFSSGRGDCAELGVLFVKPEYRRHGVGMALWGAAVEMARSLNLDMLYARSVTGHRASQSLAVHYGFHDMALYLELFPRAVELKAMGGVQPGKMSGMLQVLPLGRPRLRRIAPPARHADVVRDLYRRCGLPAETGRIDPSAAPPVYRIERMPVMNAAWLEIEHIGDRDRAVRWIDRSLRACCREKTDVIFLYLNLEEEHTAHVAEACGAMGCLFAGVFPGAFPGADALVMQYLNLADNPFACMAVWTDTARMLRDYIMQDYRARETGGGEDGP